MAANNSTFINHQGQITSGPAQNLAAIKPSYHAIVSRTVKDSNKIADNDSKREEIQAKSNEYFQQIDDEKSPHISCDQTTLNEINQLEENNFGAQNQPLSNNLASLIPNQKIFRQPTFSTGVPIAFTNKQQPKTPIQHTQQHPSSDMVNSQISTVNENDFGHDQVRFGSTIQDSQITMNGISGNRLFKIRRISQGSTPTQASMMINNGQNFHQKNYHQDNHVKESSQNNINFQTAEQNTLRSNNNINTAINPRSNYINQDNFQGYGGSGKGGMQDSTGLKQEILNMLNNSILMSNVARAQKNNKRRSNSRVSQGSMLSKPKQNSQVNPNSSTLRNMMFFSSEDALNFLQSMNNNTTGFMPHASQNIANGMTNVPHLTHSKELDLQQAKSHPFQNASGSTTLINKSKNQQNQSSHNNEANVRNQTQLALNTSFDKTQRQQQIAIAIAKHRHQSVINRHRNNNMTLAKSLSRNKSMQSGSNNVSQNNSKNKQQAFIREVYLQQQPDDRDMLKQQSSKNGLSMVKQLKKIFKINKISTQPNSPAKNARQSQQKVLSNQSPDISYFENFDTPLNDSLMMNSINKQSIQQQSRKIKIKRPQTSHYGSQKRAKSVMTVTNIYQTPKNSDLQRPGNNINNDVMMNLLQDDNEFFDRIIPESPEGENQQTFHKEGEQDRNGAKSFNCQPYDLSHGETQLLIDDDPAIPLGVHHLSTFKTGDPSSLYDISTYQPSVQQQLPPSTYYFPSGNGSEISTTQALCQKLISLFAEKTSIEAELEKVKEENLRLKDMQSQNEKIKAVLELKDREIKKLEQDNQNKKQAKKRLRQQMEAMKQELEKEKAQFFNEFKLQKSFRGALMNQNSLKPDGLSVGGVELNSFDAPADVFFKRLSRSTISQNNQGAVTDIPRYNSRSPSSNGRQMTPVVQGGSNLIQNKQLSKPNGALGHQFQDISLKRETLQIPDVYRARHQTSPIAQLTNMINRTAPEQIEKFQENNEINLKNVNQLIITQLEDSVKGQVTQNNHDRGDSSSISISTINAKNQPPNISSQINSALNESRSIMIKKWKENISNSDMEHNQGSGRPQINISMGIGTNKFGNNSSQVEEEEEKVQAPQLAQQDTQKTPQELIKQKIIPSLKEEIKQQLTRPKTITAVMMPLDSGNISSELGAAAAGSVLVENPPALINDNQGVSSGGVTNKSSITKKNMRGSQGSGFGLLTRQNTFIKTDSGKLQPVTKVDKQGIPILQRQFTKINYKDMLANNGPSILQQPESQEANSGSQTLHDLLRVRTMMQASEKATKSMDGIFNTLTNTFIEQMTMKEEQLTERCLVQLLDKLKLMKKTFIEIFGPIVYDVNQASTKQENNKARFITTENQFILDQDFFETLTKELDMNLTEDTKRSLVQYLGRKYRKDTIMFDYKEMEKLTMIAHLDPGDRFSYLTSDGIDLNLLNSKSFRVINRIREYMDANQITLYSQLFPDGMIKVSKIKQLPLIQIDDFYNRLQTLKIRQSREKIEDLTQFLNHDFRKKYLQIYLLAKLVDLSRQSNPYILSFGTKRRRLPEHLKQTIYQDMELQKKKIVEEEDEDSIESQSSFLKSSQSQQE